MARDIFQSLSPGRSYNQRYFPVAPLVLPSCFTTTVNENVPRSKAGIAADGDLFADVGDPPVEPGLLLGEDAANERLALRFPHLHRLVGDHQYEVVGHHVDERIAVESVLAGLQTFPDCVQGLNIFLARWRRLMTHTQQVARRIDNRELVHPPRLVDGSREPGNATQRQLQRRELSVELAGIGHTPITRRLVRPGARLLSRKKCITRLPRETIS